MSIPKVIASLLAVSVLSVFPASAFQDRDPGTQQGDEDLPPRFNAFLGETQLIMSEEERKVFLSLNTNRERNYFISKYWNSRGGRRNAIRENINLLMFLRLVQELDLTEDQSALILPAMNRIEKDKQKASAELLQYLAELKELLEEEEIDSDLLEEKMARISQIRETVRLKDDELEQIVFDAVTPVQKAKYILFSQDFYRGLREALQRARLQRERRRKK